MATVPALDASTLTRRSRAFLLSSEVWLRLALVPLAIGLCYCFKWGPLRFLTSEGNLRLDSLTGIALERVSYDTVRWRGVLYSYENACTFVDVWFGCLPLLWDVRRSCTRNLVFFALVALGLFAFNIVRLSFSDMLFAVGVPWDLAHNVISGVAYFLVWVWIWTHRPF